MAWESGPPPETAAVNVRPLGTEPAVERVPAECRVTVAYFGPDLNDAAVRRRVAQWKHAGFQVLPFAFVRAAAGNGPSDIVSLGTLMPQSLIRRAFPLMRAALRLLRYRDRIAEVDIFIARNLDNALLALFARRLCRSGTSLVYEVFDVNRTCTDRGLRAVLLRRLERWMLGRANLLVVSSPHFFTGYYQPLLHYQGDWSLFENKVPRWAHEREFGKFTLRGASARARPWRIGWFGYLDDEKSWEILRRLAESLPKGVIINVRGMPYSDFDMTGFLVDVQRMENVVYGGPYRNPEDLIEVYSSVDLVWTSDCNASVANSKWLLTNSLYEAGYFGKPVLAIAQNAVGDFVNKHGTGWCLEESTAECLIDLISKLSPEAYLAKCQKIIALRSQLFIESDEVGEIWAKLRARRSQQPVSDRQEVEDVALVKIAEIPMARSRKVLFLGFFPPPVDGQRLITQSVFDRFSKITQVQRYGLDLPTRRGLLSKLVSAFGACGAMLRARVNGFSAIYLAPHSGHGLLLSCAIAFVARCLWYSVTVHYHSYWNFGRRSQLMATFIAACGPRAVHVVLAPPMGCDLRQLYPTVRTVVTVSNCAFVAPYGVVARDCSGRRLRIGHLSNLSMEKGMDLVAGYLRALCARGVDAELWLAGPAENKGTAALIAAAQSEFGDRLRYLGRLLDKEVRDFYQDIDIFLFPTLYRHEAEPLVLIDALAAGVPVLSTDRGCIGYLLGRFGGRALPAEDFIEKAVEQTAAWEHSSSLLEASRQARARFLNLHRDGQAQFERLTEMILRSEPTTLEGDRVVASAPPRQTG
jgi:succinoglycan biosynthesis protein ExoL